MGHHSQMAKPLCLLALVVTSSVQHACGTDDDSASNVGSTGGAGGSVPSDAATSSQSGGGSGGEHSPITNPMHECKPETHADDACLACTVTHCCEELMYAATYDEQSYGAYEVELRCMIDCFESSDDDAGTDGSSLQRLLDCAPQCYPRSYPFDYVDRNLLACVTGTTRPVAVIRFGQATWIEGEPDEDAGVAPSCTAECLPSWE